MISLCYEILLRTIYDSNRKYRNGSDAAIYREMENAFRDLTLKSTFSSDQEREYEFQKTFAAVRNNVSFAVRKYIHDNSWLAKDQRGYLEMIDGELKWNFFDKERMDAIIAELANMICKDQARS